MAFSARAVANYFLARAESAGRRVDQMQMQKLVYYAHGWHLALTGRPLLRETIEAWAYGPVVPVLFQEFKRWGSGPIGERAYLATARMFLHNPLTSHEASLDREATNDHELAETKRILDRVWDVYSRYNGVQLSTMTHAVDSPWSEVRRAHPGERDVEIPNDMIQRFFAARLNRERNAITSAIS